MKHGAHRSNSELNQPLDAADAGAAARSMMQAAASAAPLDLETRARVRRRLRARLAEEQGRAGARRFGEGAAWASFALAVCMALLLSPRVDAPVATEAVADAGRGGGGELQRAPVSVAAALPARLPKPAQQLVPQSPAAPGAGTALAVASVEAPAVRDARPAVSERLRQRWRQQRWANRQQRGRERIEAVVDAVLKPDARLLERARVQVEHDPARALALLEAFRRIHPDAELPAPSVVVEVDALRRLGRFDAALERARGLLASGDRGYYGETMRERFAFLDL
ncbi:MAG: hypothetical protein OEZ06_30220 [Myxococcales bacterium]|nr:hypothetical protein [Myxococcales bacterium]